MFGLTPYRKNQNLSRLENGLWDFERFFDDFMGESLLSNFYGSPRQMKVDIKENDKEFIVEAELPGVNKEDIMISLENGYLTIELKQNEQVNEEKDNFIRKERRQFSMKRSFYVENVDNERIDAKYDNGILSISLPKKEEVKSNKKQIDIN